MLKKTFSHVSGVSKITEKLLWENKIDDWESFLENCESISFIPESVKNKIKSELFFSVENLEKNNLNYFKSKLPISDHWKLLEHGKVAFVDIETTGLSRWTDEITLIGIYDGELPYQYIKGQNLEDAREKLKEFDIIVTFNGKQFDMPFIEHHLNEKYDIVHLDLRFMLSEFGIKGGLKRIEKELNIVRNELVSDVDGREAVRLWREYKKGNENAIKILKMYNIEDIVNLKHLLEYYVQRKIENGL